jgi:HAE1 family hydrophobic/amphiphilic exporter-1
VLRATLTLAVALGGTLGAAGQGGSAQAPAAPQPGPTLPLSMDQAVRMAMEASLGLKGERLNLGIADEAIAGARAAFLPLFTTGFSRTTSEQVPQNFTEGATDISSRSFGVGATLRQALRWYGADYSIDWTGSRSSTVGGTSAFNPRIGSTLTLNFSQPFWRGFRTDSTRTTLESSERRRGIADIQLEERMVSIETSVRYAYLALISAIEGLKVAQQNMDLALRSERDARARVAVGVSPQIEIIEADAFVASNREQLIVAESQISTAEDALRTLILDPARPDYWQLTLQPTDVIEVTAKEVDVEAAVKNAVGNRLDLVVMRRSLEITDLNVRLRQDSTRPSVDVNLNYSASGTGGTQFTFGSGFPPPILSQTDRGFGSVLGDAFFGAYPTWRLSLSFGYPIGRTAERTALAQVQLQKQQELLALREAEVQVVREVREAARQVRTSYERVEATRAAREASERQLEAVERRFAVGLSSSFEQQQRQLGLAMSRINELQAKIAYSRALINFETVQKSR